MLQHSEQTLSLLHLLPLEYLMEAQLVLALALLIQERTISQQPGPSEQHRPRHSLALRVSFPPQSLPHWLPTLGHSHYRQLEQMSLLFQQMAVSEQDLVLMEIWVLEVRFL